MPRGPRPHADFVHVMNRGGGRRAVFTDDNDRHAFLSMLGAACQRFGVTVLAYCLLGNHYHLVFRRNDGDISRTMQLLAGRYTAYFNRRHRTDGPLFRGRFKAVAIEDDTQLIAAVAYVHANIHDIGPHADPRTHPWSSHPIYLGRAQAPEWFDTSPVLDLIAGPAALDRLVARSRAA